MELDSAKAVSPEGEGRRLVPGLAWPAAPKEGASRAPVTPDWCWL